LFIFNEFVCFVSLHSFWNTI
jgi:hypothetical protein